MTEFIFAGAIGALIAFIFQWIYDFFILKINYWHCWGYFEGTNGVAKVRIWHKRADKFIIYCKESPNQEWRGVYRRISNSFFEGG